MISTSPSWSGISTNWQTCTSSFWKKNLSQPAARQPFKMIIWSSNFNDCCQQKSDLLPFQCQGKIFNALKFMDWYFATSAMALCWKTTKTKRPASPELQMLSNYLETISLTVSFKQCRWKNHRMALCTNKERGVFSLSRLKALIHLTQFCMLWKKWNWKFSTIELNWKFSFLPFLELLVSTGFALYLSEQAGTEREIFTEKMLKNVHL